MKARCAVEIAAASTAACIVTLRGDHDLVECTFLDSSLIRTLVGAAHQALSRGGALELVVPPDRSPVRRTLEIAHIDDLLAFHSTRAAGLASLAKRPGGPSRA